MSTPFRSTTGRTEFVSGSVTPLFPRDFGEQFVDHLRAVDSDETAERSTPLPPNGLHRCNPQPECATDADPDVPLRFWIEISSEVAPNVSVAQVREQLHE
jgi:hypothetical protein